MCAGAARSQQVADSSFAPTIASPGYAEGRGPVVLLDEAHHNFHTAGGRFFAFAKTLRRDGYVVRPLRASFTRAVLDSARILVISNALHAQNEQDWFLPTPSAFTDDEIAAVRAWVEAGGSLFLIADHMPFPGAAEKLARAFGVLFSNGFALNADEESGQMTFYRRDRSLADHPITRGRNRSESIDSLTSFTGQAFRLQEDGAPLFFLASDAVLLMPEEAWQFSKRTPRLSAAGMLQGAVLRVGKGRVAVFGEAAMFSAQLAGTQRAPMGMNDPKARQNPQFLLNVMHWLSGVLK
ncbi:MAG TPA: DUF4350 domain-containing protein [Candidatus Krumholzibacteria bacterium]|nr:DUF4350 domain-containing protein [Candidatus Krumholzibacteria bacterium]